jgi:hypothetical protein
VRAFIGHRATEFAAMCRSLTVAKITGSILSSIGADMLCILAHQTWNYSFPNSSSGPLLPFVFCLDR